MGYHVQILRRRKGKNLPITRSEIEALVASEPGLRIQPSNLRAAELDLVVSRNGKDVSWLTLQNGELWTKNPEEAEIQAMIDIATRLGARVRGDEFETYISPSETYFDQGDLDEKNKVEGESKKLLRAEARTHLIIKWGIILAFLTLGGISFLIGKMFEAR